MNTIISVITPSYNQGKFLPETIESVISQEGDFSLDYIIVDGASSDDSVATIRRYEAMIERGGWPVRCRGIRFRWLSEKDRGQVDALMKGFRGAEGGILAWLNSDDTYLPGALQRVSASFRDHPETGLLYGDAHYCDAIGTVIGRYRTEAYDFEKLAWFNFICQPAAFFRRNVLEEVGGLVTRLHYAMDYDLWIRIGRRFPCRYLPEFLATYRLHEASKTVRDETLFENSEEALQLAVKYFGWAPLTRIYNSCNFRCRARVPSFLPKMPFVVITASIICALIRSVRLNRGVSRKDLQLLTMGNFRKLFKSRLEIMTGHQPDNLPGEP
jgi:glycosyltransferase involved in cell wall biosynthesis